MSRSRAATIQAYLRSLPADRRAVVSAVRNVVARHLPKGYRETMNWGMISYEIPLTKYPQTYSGQPLMYAALGAQKQHCSLYLMCVYQDAKQERLLKTGFKRAGKKLDMGKSCIRFRQVEDLPLDVIAGVVGSTTPEQFIAAYERVRKTLSRTRKPSRVA